MDKRLQQLFEDSLHEIYNEVNAGNSDDDAPWKKWVDRSCNVECGVFENFCQKFVSEFADGDFPLSTAFGRAFVAGIEVGFRTAEVKSQTSSTVAEGSEKPNVIP